MTSVIKIAAEGPGADTALAEFLSIPGLQGHLAPASASGPAVEREVTLAAVGAVVGIAAGLVTIVDKIVAWREKWIKAAGARRLNVVIEDARGNRLALEDATPEQIAAALNTLPH